MSRRTSRLRPHQPGWWMQRVIVVYQSALSPAIGGRCRFFPTCSTYAYKAIDEWGALRGGWMALRRIGRCHPWSAGGHDPVRSRSSERVDAGMEA